MKGKLKWKDGRVGGPVIFEEVGNFPGLGHIIDQKLLDELQNFKLNHEKDLIFGTAGAGPAMPPFELFDTPECPYDMEPEDFKQRQIEKMIETFKQSGVVFVDPPHRKLDPQPYIAGLDPFDRDFDAAEVHIFKTAGVQIRNPYLPSDFGLSNDQA
jgi:hypothetical protein